MTIGYNASIVTDGLVMNYDFGNPKSFSGAVIDNRYPTPTPGSNGAVTFPTQGTGTFYRIYEGTYGGYTIQPSDVVYKYNMDVNGCHYHGGSTAVSAGQYATFSFDYYVTPDNTSYLNNYLANFENYGGGALSGGIGDSTPSVFGVWKTVSRTYGPYGSAGTQAMFLYPGGCGSSRLASNGFILYKNPQVTVTNYQLPFVGWTGARTAATGAVDLTRNRTTTTLNVTYPSGSTPLTYQYLNSTGSALSTDSSSHLNTDTHSIFFMIRFNSTGSYPNGYTGTWEMIFQYAPSGTDRSPGVWRWPSERRIHWRYDPGNSGTDFSKDAAGNQFDLNTWYYVGVTKDGGSTKMFVNGVQIGTGSVSNPKTAGNAATTLYPSYTTDLSTMGLCHVYNRVISPEEVMNNFVAIRGRFGI